MERSTLNSYKKESEKVRLLNFKVYESKLAKVYKCFEDAGGEPILIKGWAAARYYPKPWDRTPGDVDLAFRPEKIGEMEKCLPAEMALPVDIHSGLRCLDTLDIEELYENCITAECSGLPVRILRVEDHLRVLCVHWMNDGGAYKEKLWDIYYAIEQNRDKFDWDRCLDVVSPLRRVWIKNLIFLAHIYLGLEIKDLPFAPELVNLPEWFRQAVEKEWASGVKLRPLHTCLKDKKKLFEQIVKRFPPNPLQATIEMEKDFQANFRLHIQFLNFFARLSPLIKRIFSGK